MEIKIMTLEDIELKKEELRKKWKTIGYDRKVILMQVKLLDMAKDTIEKRRTTLF